MRPPPEPKANPTPPGCPPASRSMASTMGSGVGIEIDEKLVEESQRAVETKGLADKVKILHANAFDVDLRPADVVTLYVAPTTMDLLRQHMEATLRPGTRVVSHKFEVTGWVPDRMVEVGGYFVYLYTVRK